ncbi:MAG: hypothetical protein A3K03_03235 [Bdellovibrionales bacterium RIFOXYD1_FULL_44_7]|nr:MAG: hypothetical protein A3K03_03235 [Bdellovibrionales bacterium RIFOXYD1_FULL_44_7]
MGQYKDGSGSSGHLSQVGWIHELARGEMHPEAEKLLQLGRSFDPQQLVEESTIEFLSELKQCFNEFARLFNGYSEAGTKFQEVKVYSVAQTAADFMVFRNQVKLVVTNSAHGAIQLSFAQHVRNNLAVDGQSLADVHTPGGVNQAQELLAQVGPFRDVYWTFQGEKVTASQVAKFYFAEFVRSTRDAKKLKTGNQLLLEQIKTLLQEKGLDL